MLCVCLAVWIKKKVTWGRVPFMFLWPSSKLHGRGSYSCGYVYLFQTNGLMSSLQQGFMFLGRWARKNRFCKARVFVLNCMFLWPCPDCMRSWAALRGDGSGAHGNMCLQRVASWCRFGDALYGCGPFLSVFVCVACVSCCVCDCFVVLVFVVLVFC